MGTMRRLTTVATAGALLAVGAVAVAAPPAAADTLITVTTTADTVDPADGLVSLREAIDQANAAAALDPPAQITLATNATYDLTHCTPVGAEPPGNRSGEPRITVAHQVTIHGNGSTVHQTCVSKTIIHTSDALTLDNLQLDGGQAGALDVLGALTGDHVAVTGTTVTGGVEAAVTANGPLSL